jgi:hypothetical protein
LFLHNLINIYVYIFCCQIKFAKKPGQGTAAGRRKELEVKRSSQLSDTDELNLELRTVPAATPSSSGASAVTTTTTAAVEVHPEEHVSDLKKNNK